MREGVTNRGGVAGEGSAARTPVKTFQAYLPPAHRTYSCIHCRAHLASHDELISKVRVRPSWYSLFNFLSVS